MTDLGRVIGNFPAAAADRNSCVTEWGDSRVFACLDKDVDGRDKPGHDTKATVSFCGAW
jgi:hypothetical protein